MAARLSVAAILALAVAPHTAWASAGEASAQGMATAQVEAPLVIGRVDDLSFGTIFAGTTSGTVTISPTGARSHSGGALPANLAGSPSHAASFTVQGEPGRSYAVTLPAAIIAAGVLTDGSGGQPPSVTIDAFRAQSASQPAVPSRGKLDEQGADRLYVGGTLHLPGGLPGANYEAEVPIIVTYG